MQLSSMRLVAANESRVTKDMSLSGPLDHICSWGEFLKMEL